MKMELSHQLCIDVSGAEFMSWPDIDNAEWLNKGDIEQAWTDAIAIVGEDNVWAAPPVARATLRTIAMVRKHEAARIEREREADEASRQNAMERTMRGTSRIDMSILERLAKGEQVTPPSKADLAKEILRILKVAAEVIHEHD